MAAGEEEQNHTVVAGILRVLLLAPAVHPGERGQPGGLALLPPRPSRAEGLYLQATPGSRALGTSALGGVRLYTPACLGGVGANGSDSQQVYLPMKHPQEQESAVTMA